MKKLFLIMMAFVPIILFAQAETDNDADLETEDDIVYENYLDDDDEPDEAESENFEMWDVSERAEFKGGDEGLNRYLAGNIQYPKAALENDTSGTVMLMFIVDKKGRIKNIEVISKRIGYGLEEEAIRVVRSTSGMWQPAMQRDKPVNMRFRLPIRFVLY
ncbi:MAG: energy transducer TonB [Bacteroidia bacterium]|nr:energy transducer TonB [Bacteroidia bacterium]